MVFNFNTNEAIDILLFLMKYFLERTQKKPKIANLHYIYTLIK